MTRPPARLVLGLLRLTFGSLALAVPDRMVARVEGEGADSPAAVYAFRMFGIRTVLIGRALLRDPGPELDRALAEAPLIHLADTTTATLLTVSGRLPPRTGLSLIAVSGLNSALALAAWRDRTDA